MFCTLAAPTFLPATLFVLENSVRNANVGDPLVAFSTSPDFQVQFQILQTYASKAYLRPTFIESLLPDDSLFWVDVCSGQVKVRTGGVDVLNYEGVNTYTITVRAFVSGFAGAETIRNISISVLNIDERPIVNPVSVTMLENAAWIPGTASSSFVWQNKAGSAIGEIDEGDPENSTVVFAIIADSTLRSVSVDNSTGLISVSNSFLDSANNMTEMPSFSFETQPNVFTLYVSATQTNNSAFTASSTFIITLLDANDPPLIERNQLLRLLDSNPLLSSAGFVSSYDEDADVAFNNGTSYSLLAGSDCGQTSKWPTVDGLSSGTPLFSINSVTGEVTWVQSPTIIWTTITPPVIFSGKLTRRVYEICVKTLDVFGGSDQQIVTVAITADIPGIAIIKNQTGLTTSMTTQGGETVMFGGENFWPNNVAPLSYTATYSNGLRTYTAACQFPSSLIIMCTTVPGFDFGYTWSITLNPVQWANAAAPILSEIELSMGYGAPTVSAISVPSIAGALSHKNLPTTSSVEIVITGTNFGPANSNPVFYYGNQCINSAVAGLVCHEFECLIKSWAHTNITCLSAFGIGEDLEWELHVGRLSVTSEMHKSLLLSYAPPTITSVVGRGIDIQKLDTVGKQLVTISGNNFGPSSITWRVGMNSSVHDTLSDPAYLVKPMYGGTAGTLLSFTDCLIQSTSMLRCFTVAGVGVNHRVSIIVGGQSEVSLWPTGNSSLTSTCTYGLCYRSPILTRISGVGTKNADTTGGQLVTITGRYFGPKGFYSIYSDAIGTVCYGNPIVAPCMYKALNCQVSVDSELVSEMICITAPGTGRDLQWSVTIGTQLASFATPLLLSYDSAPPEIYSITYSTSGLPATAANVNGGEVVSLNGRNLAVGGLVQLVTYGKIGSEFIATNWTAVSDSQILVVLSPGIGTSLHFSVMVADQMSAPSIGTFSYAIPTITLISLTRPSTLGGAMIAVDTKNLPLMDKTASFSVLLGQERSRGGFGVHLKLIVPQIDVNAIAARTNIDGSVRGYFQLPTNFAGSNLGVAIAVAQGSSNMFISNVSSINSVISFADPVINSIVVTRGQFVSANARNGDEVLCPAWPNPSWSCTGANVYQLTINGANFGMDPRKMTAADDPDGVLRFVSVQVDSGWSTASPDAPYDSVDEIFLQEWSHTRIVVFVKQTSGTVRVQLKTRSTYLQPIGANSLQTATLAFANLNPTISNIAGSTTNVPTAGTTTSAVTITVDGLTGATDLKIFVGGNHLNGTEAFIECPGTPVKYPCTGLDLTGPIGYITTQTMANAGQAVVKFYPPPGQGLNQPVVAVVYISTLVKPSNQGFTISYAAPLITGFRIMTSSATIFSPLQNVSTSQDVIFASTNGSTKVRIFGSNFGTEPIVTVGDTIITVASTNLSRCDSANLVHTCLEFIVPEGEGNGKGEQYADLNIDREGTNLPKGFTIFASTPVLHGKSQISNMVPFSYLPSTITSITSASGLFPSEGGVQLVIVGMNFGAATNPLRVLNPMTVRMTRNGVENILCLDVQRYSHTQLTCYFPTSARDNFNVVATIAGVQGESGTFFLGNPSPTPSPSPSGSQTPSPTGTSTQSPSVTPTTSPSPSSSVTPTQTITSVASSSITPSATTSPTPSQTPSGTGSPTQTPTQTSTPTPSLSSGSSASITPTATPSPTQTPTPSQTPSQSPSQTPSGTGTPTQTPSGTSSQSPTPSPTSSPTPSLSTGASSSITPSGTPSPTSSPTPSQTPSQTSSSSGTGSLTETPTVSGSQTLTGTSPLSSPTPSLSNGASASNSATVSSTSTPSSTQTPTPSLSLGATPSTSQSLSPTISISSSISPIISSGNFPSTTTARSAAASITASTISAESTASSSSAPPPPPGVQVGLVFGNVNPTIFTNATTRKTLEAAFAKAANVNPSIVIIVSIINKDSGSLIFSGGGGRRLQTANVEVTSRILLQDVNAAAVLNEKISQDAFVFSSSVVSFLKTTDSASFSQASASVSSIKMTTKTGTNPSTSSDTSSTMSWLTLTVFSSSVAGALGISAILGCLFAYYYCSRSSTKSEKSDDNNSKNNNGPQVIIINRSNVPVQNFQVSNPLGRESSRPHANVRGRHGVRGLPNIDNRSQFSPVMI